MRRHDRWDGAAGEHAGGDGIVASKAWAAENFLLENLGRIRPDAGLRMEPLRLRE